MDLAATMDRRNPCHPPDRDRRSGRRLLALVGLILAAPGCQSFVSPITKWRAAYDGGLFQHITKQEVEDTTGSTDPENFMQRWLSPRPNFNQPGRNNPVTTEIMGSDGWRPIARPRQNPKADAELKAAKALYNSGKYAEAEKAFAVIAKERKGTPWGNEAIFCLGEAQFKQKKYVQAHDTFERLHAEDPATEHLDELVSREYAIAHLWLAQVDPQSPRKDKIPWTGRFDGRLPLIDTAGSAIRALEHVRHNNPEGPLADDAAIELADYYLKHNDFEDATIYYDQFIKEYPKSPFLQDAQHKAIEARMKAFRGPDYDASILDDARKLIRQSMSDFPDQKASEKLYRTLDLINDAEAEKTYRQGMYYKRIGKPTSAEYYLGKIPRRWPNSTWAVKAKSELAALAKVPRKPSKPSKIMVPPGATDPYFNNGPMGMMGMGMGGMGMMGMGPGMM